METYSMDLRERVIRACDEKVGTRTRSRNFSTSARWISRLLQRRRESGDFSARRRGGCTPPKFRGKKLEQLKAWVEEQPDVTLQELLDRSGVDASIMAVHRALVRLDCRAKKVAPRRRTGSPGCQGQARALAREGTAQIDPHRLVFLDESGAKTNMTRLYGRAFGGKRVVDCSARVALVYDDDDFRAAP